MPVATRRSFLAWLGAALTGLFAAPAEARPRPRPKPTAQTEVYGETFGETF